jgi:hypothetical protein
MVLLLGQDNTLKPNNLLFSFLPRGVLTIAESLLLGKLRDNLCTNLKNAISMVRFFEGSLNLSYQITKFRIVMNCVVASKI